MTVLYPAGVIAIADAIPDMGALLHFDISNNNIRAEGGKALVEALKGNQVITTLSIAKNNLSFNSSGDNDMSGVAALADVISDMGALTKFDISNNSLCAAGAKALASGLKGNHVMTELDLAGNAFGNNGWGGSDVSGVVALADAIPDMGALTSLNLSSNDIGAYYDSQKGMVVATLEGIFVVVVPFVLTLYSM
jgi:hypothetical protein